MLPLGVLLYMNLAIYKGMKRLHGPVSTQSVKRKKRSISTGKSTLNPPDQIESGNTSPGIRASFLNMAEEEDERDRDARFTRASILMVLAFGLCHTPRLITNTAEMFSDRAHLPDVSICMYVVNMFVSEHIY